VGRLLASAVAACAASASVGLNLLGARATGAVEVALTGAKVAVPVGFGGASLLALCRSELRTLPLAVGSVGAGGFLVLMAYDR